MSLPVTPPDAMPTLAGLVLDHERRSGSQHPAQPEDASTKPHGPMLASGGPVNIDDDTSAALADLEAIDTVPLAVAIDRYNEDA